MGKSTSGHYTGARGRNYAAGRFTDRMDWGRRYQARYFAPFCRDDATVVDYGCGDGTILREIAVGRKIGIEVNPACLEIIEQRNRDLDRPIEILPNLQPISDATIDVVISNHCLEHVPDPYDVLSAIRRVLVPAGRLIIVTPFDDWRAQRSRRYYPGSKDNHLFTWTPLNIGNLLVEAGFVVEVSRLESTAWTPKIFWVHRLLGPKIFSLAARGVAILTHRREVFTIAHKPGLADAGGRQDD